jgi:hypothetical protein
LSSLLLGLVLGSVRLATGSILAPILLSAGISALGLIAIGTKETWPIEGLSIPGGHTGLTLLLPSILTVAWGMRGMIEAARESPVAIPLSESDS